jgi:membrane-associated phospholipid phosphatase
MSSQRDDERTVEEYHVFVPAVMGAGIVFSILVVVRDWLDRLFARDRRRAAVEVQARLVADEVLGRARGGASASDRPTDARRRTSAAIAAVLLGIALYVLPGATFNYLRPGGYLGEIAWILALALLLVVFSSAVGLVALSALGRGRPNPAAMRLLRTAETIERATVSEPAHRSWGERWHGAASIILLVTGSGAALVTLVVAMGHPALQRWDAEMLNRAELWTSPILGLAERLGRTGVVVPVSIIAAVIFRRSAPRLALGFPIAVATGLVVNVLLKVVVDRPRPASPAVGTALPSYPSGHVIQAVLLAVMVTAVAHEWFRSRTVTLVVATLFGAGATLTAGHRVVYAAHWPSDVIGGVLIAATIAVVTLLAIHPGLGTADARASRSFLSVRVVATARRFARITVVVSVVGFVGLAATIGLPRDPGAGLGTFQIEQGVQVALLVLVVIGAALGWRREAVGACWLAAVGTAMAVFSSVQYPPTVALAVAVAFLLPAGLFWLAWQHERSARSLVVVAVVGAVLLSGTWVAATSVYEHYFGPSHPESSLTPVSSAHVAWIWSGAPTTDSVTVTARLTDVGPEAEVLVHLGNGPELAEARSVRPARDRAGTIRATLAGLDADTEYHYAVSVDGRLDRARLGRVRTVPEGPSSFVVAFSACARTGSNGAVFDAIAELDPLLYVITGDFHYGNVASPDEGALRAALGRTLTAPAQQALYLNSPIAYVWDDHDYGGNDSDAASPARSIAQSVYRSVVPHGDLPSGEGIQQSFTVGRVRFVLTDTRSYRQPAADGSGTLLGLEQLRWFQQELRAARDADQIVIWVSPTPWIGRPAPGSDTWAGFHQERQLIADFIDAEGIDRLVMLSGDAHMVAIDDGTNSGYARSGARGFPVAHAGALDRPGSVKGGPYSEGAFAGSGQFGVLEVDDGGDDEVLLRISGRTWTGDELVSLELEL